MFLKILCIVLSAVILFLAEKNRLLKKNIDEISIEFKERLMDDTNTLISLSSRNRHAQKLAIEINEQLKLLRTERQRFQNGDRELKEAVTNIAHDLRTPLTAIYGYLDLIEKEEKSEAAQRYIDIITSRVEALKQLVEELFRYSVVTTSTDNMYFERLSLNKELEESVSYYYVKIKESGIEPKIEMPDTAVLCSLDKQAVSRILGNVISNAVKYSDGDLEITLTKTGEMVFTNTASSLNEVQVGNLFDRFYTVEAARKSTGLGLSIARHLVIQMNGEISAKFEDKRLSIIVKFPTID